MKQLIELEVKLVFGGVDTIIPGCIYTINAYSVWWFYGVIIPETFIANANDYCIPNNLVLVDSTDLDIVACVTCENLAPIYTSCFS